MALDAATRSSLLTSMIEQLQADHEAAAAESNTSARIAASKAIADLLAIKLSPDTAEDEKDKVTTIVLRGFSEREVEYDLVLSLVRRISELEHDGASDDELRQRAQAMIDECRQDRELGDAGTGAEPVSDHGRMDASGKPDATDFALGERLLELLNRGNELDRIMGANGDP